MILSCFFTTFLQSKLRLNNIVLLVVQNHDLGTLLYSMIIIISRACEISRIAGVRISLTNFLDVQKLLKLCSVCLL